jgi:hypothetical protein
VGSSSGNALFWRDWRVEQINLDGRLVLRIRQGRYLIGYAKTLTEALALLGRHGVPLDRLSPEPVEFTDDDAECE